MNQKKYCPYCGTETLSQNYTESAYVFVDCPTCGRFMYQVFPCIAPHNKDKIASYLYYTGMLEAHNDARFFNFIGDKSEFDKIYAEYPWAHFASISEIEAFYPRTFAGRIDKILLGMTKKSEFFGVKFTYTLNQLLSAMFVCRYNNQGENVDSETVECQLSEICYYLKMTGYVEYLSYADKFDFLIKPTGYKRIDELQIKESQASKNVFIAMSFSDDMKDVREAIKTAVFECGYIPRIMDEIEHNHQIVPEMLYEIQQAKFVIAELTGHNNGAYFEAGYALGYGKEVIQVCSKERFGTDGHFDVKQINTILWNDIDELEKKLFARIKATIK